MRIKDIRGIRIQLEEIYDSLMTLRRAGAIQSTVLQGLFPRGFAAAVAVRPDDGEDLEDDGEDLEDEGEDLEGFCGVSSAFGPRPDAEVKKYVEPIRIAGKLELKIGMFDGRHNREFVLYTIPDEEIDTEQLIPFWTTKLKTEELIELKEAIIEALLTASRWDFE